jgi:hypothetical protein
MNQFETTKQSETEKLHAIVRRILAQKMEHGSMFTAYDVLKEVRDQDEPACYPQVETIVEMFMDREPDYTHTFRSFDNGYYCATVYHPQGTDAHSYDPDRQLFDLPEFMTYAEAADLNPTRGEIEYLFKDQGWYGIARLFYGYENQAMKLIDPDGAYWGPEHAKDLKTGDLVETFYWLKDVMLYEISKAEDRRAEEQRYLALWDKDDDED